ncbi:MAG TPA: ATP-binding protein [Candidatus Acidoferrum sp.]|jgi:signal transduction histidine kinase
MTTARKHSITKKLTRMNMLATGLALFVACASFVVYDLTTFRDGVVRNLSVQAQVAGSNSVTALVFNDPHSAENTLSALKAAPNIVYAGIYTLEGQPFAVYRRDPNSKVLPLPARAVGEVESHWFEDGDVLVVHAIVFQGKPVGTAYFRSDTQRLKARMWRYAIIAVLVLVASLWTALLLSSVLQRSIAEPILHLADTARIVSRDRIYSLRVKPTTGRDELSLLTESFNEMLTQIEERDHALQEARDEFEKRVEERTFQLAAANKELESFSYSVSHDLRAPLRSIDGFGLALLEDCTDTLSDEGKSHVRRIRASTQRMGTMIDDFLNLARVTRAKIHLENVDLTSLARGVASELQNAEPGRRAVVRIEDGLAATGDSHLLRIVMENLFGNAWKFTSKRTESEIEFGATRLDESQVYFVRDNGAGFDSAHKDKLFGTFQRLHAATEYPGTGVGLATVQRIIRRHGGQIWADGVVDKGATFYFTL